MINRKRGCSHFSLTDDSHFEIAFNDISEDKKVDLNEYINYYKKHAIGFTIFRATYYLLLIAFFCLNSLDSIKVTLQFICQDCSDIEFFNTLQETDDVRIFDLDLTEITYTLKIEPKSDISNFVFYDKGESF